MNVILTLEPPSWLQKDLKLIADKAAEYMPIPDIKHLASDQFKEIYCNSGLKVPDFASRIDVSPQMVYKILNGAKISNKLSKKVREEFE